MTVDPITEWLATQGLMGERCWSKMTSPSRQDGVGLHEISSLLLRTSLNLKLMNYFWNFPLFSDLDGPRVIENAESKTV